MTKQTDILIIGGGNAGLCLGALLHQAGADILVIDPRPAPKLKDIKPSGRTVALMETSINILKGTGIWDKLESHACPLKTMRIIDDSMASRDPLEAAFHAEDIGLEQYGFNIPNGILQATLAETLPKKNYLTPKTLHDYSHEGTHVIARFDDGDEIKAKIIIGADGRGSVVRACAGIEASKRHYDQAAITCLINHSNAHQNIATEFHRPAGPLAFVPMNGNQSSVVWVETKAKAEELLKLKKQEFEHALQDASQDTLGGITLETGPQSWPLCSIKAKTLTAPRTALIAEAAHVMSPITAQGLNLSLRDIAALAEVLVDGMRVGLDPGDPALLQKYEKRRSLDINTRVFGVDGMNRIVSQDIEGLKGLRRAGLKVVHGLPGIKETAMRIGLAPQIDLGRLAQGEAL